MDPLHVTKKINPCIFNEQNMGRPEGGHWIKPWLRVIFFHIDQIEKATLSALSLPEEAYIYILDLMFPHCWGAFAFTKSITIVFLISCFQLCFPKKQHFFFKIVKFYFFCFFHVFSRAQQWDFNFRTFLKSVFAPSIWHFNTKKWWILYV